MKLKKATNITIDYPSRESIKPILVGVGMALSLSACTQTVGQEPIIKDERTKIEESANIAGGMPVYIPPPKEQNSSTPPVKKFKKSKEKIVPPEVTAGVPAPRDR